MTLVEYSQSSESSDGDVTPANKRRKTQAARNDGSESTALPPLPTNFHDLYSSTVRTSLQDDPSLHGGRRRVKPHVDGNWPTHVYLEWLPRPSESGSISALIEELSSKDTSIKSLLHNNLGVALPLHVSLSRPLQLRTEQRDDFRNASKQAISRSGVRTFNTSINSLKWHANETKTRWFLVLAFKPTDQDELRLLLDSCNTVAEQFDQPLLYTEEPTDTSKFHISIAWSLSDPTTSPSYAQVPPSIRSTPIAFNEIKIRIGQEVHTIPLPTRRKPPR